MTRAKARERQVWVVRCAEYESKPLPSRDAAEAHLDAIDRLGACSFPHSIEIRRQKLGETA